MATTTEPAASKKRELSRLASPPGSQKLYGAALRSSQATTLSLQEGSTALRTPRKVCPGCGFAKAQSAHTCKACYLKKKVNEAVHLECDCCSKPFLRQRGEHEKSLSRHGKDARTFCGRPCYDEYKRLHPAEYSTSHGICVGCGAPLVGKEQKKFCSHTCYTDHRATSRTTESYGAAWLATKSLISARDKVCLLCGDRKARMEVHHVDHDSENQDMKNLALLCMPCHKRYHAFTEPAQKTLQGLFSRLVT